MVASTKGSLEPAEEHPGCFLPARYVHRATACCCRPVSSQKHSSSTASQDLHSSWYFRWTRLCEGPEIYNNNALQACRTSNACEDRIRIQDT